MRKEPKVKKIAAVDELKAKISGSISVILTDYSGLTVEEISKLRKQLRKTNTEYKVVKNTLMKRAVDATENQDAKLLNDFLTGPVAIAFSKKDEIGPAKVLHKFIKDFEKLAVKGGLVNDKFFSSSQIKELSMLPSRQQLIAQVVGGMKSPIYGIYGVMSGLLRNFVYVLNEIKGVKSK